MGHSKVGIRRRSRTGSSALVAIATAVSMGSFITPSAGQTIDSNIEFLNPSSFANTGELGIVISDRVTSRPEAGDGTYRLSAWVSNPPIEPAVEFELLRNGISLVTIDADRQIGGDTWEADWNIPDGLAGQYTLRATLGSSNFGVDSVDQEIAINALAERTEIDYPTVATAGPFPGGSRFGTFHPLATATGTERPNPAGNIDGKTTGESDGSGTSRVRAFYTTSVPGSVPEWFVCGTEAAPGDALLSSASNDGVRCALQSPDQQSSVSAVALVANSSNRGSYDPRLNGAGDAVRVLEAYAQTSSDFKIIEGGVQEVEAGDNGSYLCHTAVAALKDQYGREIVGANIDVEAAGPTDQLRFDTGLLPVSDLQAPDQGGHAPERGYDCFGDDDEATPGDQGEHQVIGGPDLKHVEATAGGTDDTGIWGFSVRVPPDAVDTNKHTTYFSMWVDEEPLLDVNDDAFTSTGELCASGAVGWGAFPASATGPPVSLLPCQPPPLCPPDEPEEGETTPPPQSDGQCPEPPAVTQHLGMEARKRRGSRVVFRGQLSSDDESCQSGRTISLKSRRSSNRRFATRSRTTTDADGRWKITRRVRRNSQWRSVARASACPVVRSRVVRISRARR